MRFSFAGAHYSVQAKIIIADFTDTEEIYEDIYEELKSLPIGVLGMQNSVAFNPEETVFYVRLHFIGSLNRLSYSRNVAF